MLVTIHEKKRKTWQERGKDNIYSNTFDTKSEDKKRNSGHFLKITSCPDPTCRIGAIRHPSSARMRFTIVFSLLFHPIGTHCGPSVHTITTYNLDREAFATSVDGIGAEGMGRSGTEALHKTPI